MGWKQRGSGEQGQHHDLARMSELRGVCAATGDTIDPSTEQASSALLLGGHTCLNEGTPDHHLMIVGCATPGGKPPTGAGVTDSAMCWSERGMPHPFCTSKDRMSLLTFSL